MLEITVEEYQKLSEEEQFQIYMSWVNYENKLKQELLKQGKSISETIKLVPEQDKVWWKLMQIDKPLEREVILATYPDKKEIAFENCKEAGLYFNVHGAKISNRIYTKKD
jgi:hypothetical protein